MMNMRTTCYERCHAERHGRRRRSSEKTEIIDGEVWLLEDPLKSKQQQGTLLACLIL
jgi:hypothetical protein